MQSSTIGLIVNPIAGMGGSVGLKGTDGSDILDEAMKRGANPVAADRCIRTLASLKRLVPSTRMITCPGDMWEKESLAVKIPFELLPLSRKERTSADDTKLAAKQLEGKGLKFILFAGGDGTARDISLAIDARIAVLGIPCGVKNYSAVFATSPESAGTLAAAFVRGEVVAIESEVLDFDEDQMRKGIINTTIRGVLRVPSSKRFLQNAKLPSQAEDEEIEQEALAKFVVEEINPEFQYVLGPGSTTRKIAQLLGVEKTLLGVDVLYGRKIMGKDVTGPELEELVSTRRTKLIITPIGGQGYILGRGNQQLTPTVIRKIGRENIVIVCTRTKFANLADRRFLVDTGEKQLDEELRGYWRAVVGYGEFAIVKVD